MGTQLPLKRGISPTFRPMSIVDKRLGPYMDQDATWYGARPIRTGDIVLDGNPAPP